MKKIFFLYFIFFSLFSISFVLSENGNLNGITDNSIYTVNYDEVIPDSNLDNDWKNWKLKYKKNYENNEEKLRRSKWEYNLKKINKHNTDYEAGKVTYKLGINCFGDLDNKEYRKFLKSVPDISSLDVFNTINSTNSTTTTSTTISTVNTTTTKLTTTTTKTTTKIPDYIDWRTKGFITPVKDQLGCGCCWAFSANAALEAANAKKTGKLISFSEQQLIDCSKSYGTNGCNGGWMTNAFKYVIANKGINNDTIYPYEDIDTGMCRANANATAGTCSSFVNLPRYNETRLTLALLTIPAVSVGIDSYLDTFQFYESGVYYDPNCDPINVNHGVTVVGYGSDLIGGDYYIVKNSWGEWWGESGYIRMARNRNNNCGIASFPNYPVV